MSANLKLRVLISFPPNLRPVNKYDNGFAIAALAGHSYVLSVAYEK